MNSNNANPHNNHYHPSHPMKYHLSTASAPDGPAGLEPVSQLRCYLCDIPKQEYALTRAFSELICRGCLNYEGPDRVEQLIAKAYQIKKRHTPLAGATPPTPSINSAYKSQAARGPAPAGHHDGPNIRPVQSMAYHTPPGDKQIPHHALEAPPSHNHQGAHGPDRCGGGAGAGSILRDGLAFGKPTGTHPEASSLKHDRSPSRSPPAIVWENRELQDRLTSRSGKSDASPYKTAAKCKSGAFVR